MSLTKLHFNRYFKTPQGVFVIGGLQVLPMWLYGHYFRVLDFLGVPLLLQYIGIAFLSAGRALCMAVEVRIFRILQ